MHTTPSKPVNPESLHDGYEVTDAKVSMIIVLMAVIGIMGAAAFPIILGLLADWEKHKPDVATIVSPVAEPLDQVPPAPHLQQYPLRDANAYLSATSTQLNTYGIVDQTHDVKTAHIPIEKAIEMVSQGKVPYRQQPVSAATAAPTTGTN